jgi:WD40 repeat protein
MDHPSFSRDGRTLYTRTYAGLIQEWDLAGDRRFLAAMAGDPLGWDEPGARISPDGRKIGYVELKPEFRVRDVATGRLGPVVPGGMAQARYLDIAWHPDSRTLNITSGDPLVRIWDSATGKPIAERRLSPPPSTEGASIAYFSVDGKYLLVGTTKGRLHVLDAHTLAAARDPIQVYEQKANTQEIQEISNFSPSGDRRTVYLADRIVDYVAGTVRPMPKLGFDINAVFASPDGKRVLVDTGATGVGLLDAKTLHWISRPDASHAGLVGWYGEFSKDGSQFASTNESRLSVWNGRTGSYLGTVAVDYDGFPAFSNDNKRLTFAGINGSVLTWNLDHRLWIAAACRLAGRALTEQEWRNYLPNRPFVRLCA